MTTAHDMYAAVFDAYYGGPERYKARDEGPKPVIVAHSPPGERLWLRVRMPNGDTWDYGANSDELSNDILEQNFARVRGRFNLRKPRNIGKLLSHIRELSKDPDSITATKLQPRGKPAIPAVEKPFVPTVEEPEDVAPEQEPDWESDPSIPEPGMEDKYQGVERYAKRGFELPKPRKQPKSTTGQQDLFGGEDATESPSKAKKPASSEPTQAAPQTAPTKPVLASTPKPVQKTLGFRTQKSHPLSEHGMAQFEGETNKFHVENPTVELPEDRELIDTRHVVHNGKLFRVSVINDPTYGQYFNIEEGVVTNPEMTIDTQGKGEQPTSTQSVGHVQVQMRPAPFETLQEIARSRSHPIKTILRQTAVRNQTPKDAASHVLSQVKGHGKPIIESVLKKSLGLPPDQDLPKNILDAISGLESVGHIKRGTTEGGELVLTPAAKAKPKAKAVENQVSFRKDIGDLESRLKALEKVAENQTGEQLESTSQEIDKVSRELDRLRVKAIASREERLKKRKDVPLPMVDPKHGQSLRMSADDPRLNRLNSAIQSIQKRIKPLYEQFDKLSPEEQQATPSPRLDLLLDRLEKLAAAKNAAIQARKLPATTSTPPIGGTVESPPLPKPNVLRGLEGIQKIQEPPKSTPHYVRFSQSAGSFADAIVEKYASLRRREAFLNRFCAAYYGTVERYGGPQAGPHIDNEKVRNGQNTIKMTQMAGPKPLYMSGQNRGLRGASNAGQFAPDPLASTKALVQPKTGMPSLKIPKLPSPIKMSLHDQYAAKGQSQSKRTTAHGIPLIGGIPIADPSMFVSWPSPPPTEGEAKKAGSPLEAAQERPLTWEDTNELAALAVSTGKQVYEKQQQIDNLQAQARQMSGPEQAAATQQIKSLSAERNKLLKKHNAAANQTIKDLDRHFHWRVNHDKKTSPEFKDELVQYYRVYVWDALNRWTKGKTGYDPERTYNPKQAGIQTFIKTAEKAIKGRYWRDKKNFVQGLTEDAADDIREQHEKDLSGDKSAKKRQPRAIIQQFDPNYDDTEGGRRLSEARWEDTATTPELVRRLLTELRHTTNRKTIIKSAVQKLRNELKDFQESHPTKFKDRIKLSELDAKTKKQIAVLSKANNDIDRYSKSLQQSVNDTWARMHRELQGFAKQVQTASDPKTLEQMQSSLAGLQSSMKTLSEELPQHGMTIPLPDPSWTESRTPDNPISKARQKRMQGVHEGFSKLPKHQRDLLKLHFGISGGEETGKTLKQIKKEIQKNPEYQYISGIIRGSSPTRLMQAIRNAEKGLYDRLPDELRVEIAGGKGVPKGVPSQKKFVTLTADYITSIIEDDIYKTRQLVESQGIKRKLPSQHSDLSEIDNPSIRKKWAIIQGQSPTEQEIGESHWHGERFPFEEAGEFLSPRGGDAKLNQLRSQAKILEEQLQQVVSSLPVLSSGRRAKPTGAIKKKIQHLKQMVADSQKGVANRRQDLSLRYAPLSAVELAGDMKALKGIESEINAMWRQSDIDPESGRPIDERWVEHRDSPVAMDYEDIVKMHDLYKKREDLLSRTKSALSPLGRFEVKPKTEQTEPQAVTQPAPAAPPAQSKQPWETPPTAPLQTKRKSTKSKGSYGPMLFTKQEEPDKYGFVTDAAGIEVAGASTPTYEETLSELPNTPSRFPSPPKQPPRTGKEGWMVHMGRITDAAILPRLRRAAQRRNLLFGIQDGYWFTFAPKDKRQRFQYQRSPARYRAGLDKYGWRSLIGLPEKQQTPPPPPAKKPWDVPLGGDDLPDVPTGLEQQRREEREAAARRKQWTQQHPATTTPVTATAAPMPQVPKQDIQRPLSAKEVDRLADLQSFESRLRAWSENPTQTPFPDPSQGVAQTTTPKKKASQLTPEQQQKKQDLRDREMKLRETRVSRAEEREKERLKGGGAPRGRSGTEKTKVIVPEEFQITKTLPQSPPIPEGQKIPMTIGKATEIYADDYLPVQAYYAITDLHNLAPSHIIKDDSSIAPNPNYKNPGAQPRNYEPGSRNHEKVLRHYAQKRYRYWTTDNPDPVAGPPTADEQGQVSNANGRTITLLYSAARELSGHAGEYDWMRKALSESAGNYGIPPEEVAKYKFPVLVRVTPTIRAGTPEFDELARAGNRRTQQTEDPIGEAASMSKKVAPDELLADLQKKNLISGDMTLSAVLSNKDHPLVKALYNEVKQSADVASYFDDEGSLHAEGRNRAENVLLGRFIENVPLLRRADYQFRSFKNAVGDALPAIIAIGEPIKKPLEAAVKYVVTHPSVKSYQHFLDDTGKQKIMFETGKEADPIAIALLDAMYRTKKATKSGKSVWNSAAMIDMFSQMAAAVKHRRLAESGRSLLGPPESDISSDLVDAIEGSTTKEALERSERQRARAELPQGAEEPSDLSQDEDVSQPATKTSQAARPATEATDARQAASPKPPRQGRQLSMLDEPEPEQNTPAPTMTQDELIARTKTSLEANKAGLEKIQRMLAAERNSATQLYLQGRMIDVESEIAQQEKFLSQAASQSQPSPTKLSLRKTPDATVDLYTAVHMAYYGKRRHPQRGTARKFIS